MACIQAVLGGFYYSNARMVYISANKPNQRLFFFFLFPHHILPLLFRRIKFLTVLSSTNLSSIYVLQVLKVSSHWLTLSPASATVEQNSAQPEKL
jgi:hypothetical protein